MWVKSFSTSKLHHNLVKYLTLSQTSASGSVAVTAGTAGHVMYSGPEFLHNHYSSSSCETTDQFVPQTLQTDLSQYKPLGSIKIKNN